MSKKFIVRPEFRKTEILYSPITPASTNIPEWYKKIPVVKEIKLTGTGAVGTNVKHCTPFLDAMITGYTMTLTDDIHVRWENNVPFITWKTTKIQVTEHSKDQYDGVSIPYGFFPHVLKWHNEFFIKLPEGYSLWCTHPVNRFDLPFQVISGFVDADMFPLAIQFPFFIQNNWSGIIEAGTPLAQLIPIKREEWQIQYEKSSDEKTLVSRETFGKKLVRSYKTRYWNKKVYK